MKDPTTELDERFSDPGAKATSWEAARAILETAEISWISTVRVDGRPHVTPLVAVWHDGALYFTTGPEEQKAVNLRHNPQVVVTTGCNDWREALDVVVEGRARRVIEPQVLERLAAAWTAKWDGRWEYGVCDDGFQYGGGVVAHVFEVEPVKVLAFGRGGFSHTRHRPR
jgi:general stress protein 26